MARAVRVHGGMGSDIAYEEGREGPGHYAYRRPFHQHSMKGMNHDLEEGFSETIE
jgi:hypothetical protein